MKKHAPAYCRAIAIGSFALLLGSTALAATHYVDINNTAPSAPYTNWVTAATNIQDAVDIALAGSTVLVTNGLYNSGSTNINGVGNRIGITNAIILRSVNGPDATIIEGETDVRCLWLADGAVVEGFTLTNGNALSSGGHNEAQKGGGAFCAPSAVVSNCVIADCYASSQGAGVYGGVFYDCTISDCYYSFSGGGAYSSTLHRCTLDNNWASASGGGATRCVLYDCEIYNCGAQGGGGAWNSTLTRCTVAGNWAQLSGGGVSDSDAFECALAYNQATDGGGAEGGRLVNCFITGNEAGEDGGGAGFCDLVNCTIIDNEADETGGGVYRGTATNCIIYHNSAPAGSNHAQLGDAESCVTLPVPATGSGHGTNDPMVCTFINPHLLLGSPCINAGNSGASAGAADIDGDNRTVGTIDIGCDEFYAAGATGALAVAVSADPTFAQTGFPVAVEIEITGIATGYILDFGDGNRVSNAWNTSHAYAAPGFYDVVCTATNFGTSVSSTATVEVVYSTRAYVSPAGSHSEPFDGWATAATNLQDAVDVVAAGGEVIVADGIYEFGNRITNNMPNRVLIDKAVTVRSTNGPGSTVILGEGPVGADAVRCAYLGPNAVLVGFTLTNGHTHASESDYKESNGGGAYCVPGAVLSNCVVAGCSSYWDGAGLYKSMAYDCTISGNTAGDDGGGAYKSTFYDCTVTDNVCGDHGGGLDQGDAERCEFIGNKAPGYGGGAYNSVLYHCTFHGNECGERGGGAYGGELHHCTLAGNHSGNIGGGVYNADVYSSIVYGNTAATTATNYYSRFSSTFYQSCTAPDPGRDGNITNNPQYVDAPAGNLHLHFDSPCIDAGTNWTSTAIDLDGNPRPANPALWDMGAYEYNAVWSDSDGDLMTDGFENDYFGSETGGVATANSDGDPHDNLSEYIAGTDPTNGASFFAITNAWPAASGFVVEWAPSVSNRWYALLWTNDLTGAFTSVVSGIDFPQSSATDTAHSAESEGFYRMEFELK